MTQGQRPIPTAIMWSGGKDSLLMLAALLRDPAYHPQALITSINEDDGRVGMHGIRHELIAAQAQALGLPLVTVRQPNLPSNAVYEARLSQALAALKADGVQAVASGDLFLADIRAYREQLFHNNGLRVFFPLWGQNTTTLLEQFYRDGHRAIVVCVDTQQLDAAFLRRELDAQFAADLPDDVDPCGENGEYHTFVHDSPVFNQPVRFYHGDVLDTDQRFARCDLLPTTHTPLTTSDGLD